MLVEGETEIDAPVPMVVPNPQPPSYQNQLSPVAKNPPETERVVDPPGQTVKFVAFTNVAADDTGSTMIVVEIHVVVLQGPSALT